LIIAIVLFFGLLLDFYFYRRTHRFDHSDTYKIYVGFLGITLGIITAVFQLIPPSDSAFAVGWHFSFGPSPFEARPEATVFTTSLRTLTTAYLPIPHFDVNFWNNTCVWEANKYLWYLAVLSVCSFVVFSMISFVRKPFVFFLFVGCTFGLLVFFHVKYNGGIRHTGFLFIAFILSAWLYHCREQANWSVFSESFVRKLEIILSHSITLIFLLHVGASFVAASIDYGHPFSMAKSVAEYINERGLKNRLIVGYLDYPTSAIVGYLGISQVYYPQGDRFGSYIRWDKQRFVGFTQQEVVDKARQLETHELTDGNSQGVLIIVNKQPLSDELVQASKLQKIAEFTGAIVITENFYIYSFE
jgi:hypothetical protein